MRDLIAQDPDAEWDDATQRVINSNFAVSPRIVLVALFDPRLPLAADRNVVQVIRVAAFFMERMTGPAEVRGRFLRTRGEGAICEAESPPGGSFVSFCPPGVAIDVRPGSCPNPLNLRSRGVLPVAILGADDFDVSRIDPGSIRLAGVSPLRTSFEDVAAPSNPLTGSGNATDCSSAVPDGSIDLVLKFDTEAIAATLSPAAAGETRVVTLTCRLKSEFGGEVFAGQDVVTIVGGPGGKGAPASGTGDDPSGDELRSGATGNSAAPTLTVPSPYRPQAALAYVLPKSGSVRLDVYDLRGRLLATLADGRQESGVFETAWSGMDGRGRAVPQGVYFIRLQVADEVTTGKILLAR
jgi:hypothetical protein